MKKIFSMIFSLSILFVFSAFAQSSLIDYGPANVSGKTNIEAPMSPVVFLNQTPNQVNGLFADSSFNGTLQQSIAENFVVTSAGPAYGITEIVIWGGYFPENIPNATDDFTIIIHSDAGGSPGPVIYARYNLQASTRATTGVVLFGVNEYIFTFDFSASPFIITSTGTYWIEIYNNSTSSSAFFWETGNLDATRGIMGSAWTTTTPGVTWNLDPATDLSIQINGDDNIVPCPVIAPSNPNPPTGATGLPLTGNVLSWTNGAGTTMNEIYFNGNLVYDGAAVTSRTLAQLGVEPLSYSTTYTWRIVCKDAACGTTGPNWSFTTMQDPNLITETVDVYPDNANYWTGSCDLTTKTQISLVNTGDPVYGWMKFNIGIIPDNATILSMVFYGYVNATNWPYWSATPMVGVDPVTATVAQIRAPIDAGWDAPFAYVFSNEPSTFPPGWKNYAMGNNANSDLENALVQDWFSMGIIDRDFGAPQYFINFDGWAEFNRPYLRVTYEYVVPVELTSFTAAVAGMNVTLNWSTATELNNQGFHIERSNGSEFSSVGFVAGYGTTTETQNYTFVDRNIQSGSYSYRLKQVDFDGTFEYSDVVELEIGTPSEFVLDQNYPNPFNPSTKISFRLAADSKVSLKVFDVLGQEVITLINNELTAGSHSVDFDATNLNSGVYFYKIEAAGNNGSSFSDVKKMILTK